MSEREKIAKDGAVSPIAKQADRDQAAAYIERYMKDEIVFECETLADEFATAHQRGFDEGKELAAQAATNLMHQNESERDGILAQVAAAIRALNGPGCEERDE